MSDDSLHIRLPLTPGPGAWLMLDSAWPQAAVGVWREGRWLSFVRAEGPATETFFAVVEKALADAGLKLSELAGYIFCEGPGSVLGLRTAAMALRAWASTPGLARLPVLACNSLVLAGELAKTELGLDATVIAAARRDRWNTRAPGDSSWTECDTATLVTLPAPRLRLPARDTGGAPVEATAFDPVAALQRRPEIFLRNGLLFATDTPDAANVANTYATWSGERHKA